MTTTPAGSAIWSRTASFQTYGGHLEKKDYGGIGSVNALTDVNAAQLCRLTADAAATSRTAALCTMIIGRSGSVLSVSKCIPLWADQKIDSYDGSSPPSGYPGAAITGTNVVTVTLPLTASDEFGVSSNITPHVVLVGSSGARWNGVITAANAFELSYFTTGLTVSLMVW